MPNRAVRRRQERDKTRGRPRIMVGDSVIAALLGQTFAADDIDTFAEPPAKVPGRHRWMAFASYIIDMPDRLIGDADTRKLLGPQNLHYIGIGCWDCEQTYTECVDQPCPADGQDDS